MENDNFTEDSYSMNIVLTQGGKTDANLNESYNTNKLFTNFECEKSHVHIILLYIILMRCGGW